MVDANFVKIYQGRPCVTEHDVVEHFPPDLQRWVRENCERSITAFVWFLPTGESVNKQSWEPSIRDEADA